MNLRESINKSLRLQELHKSMMWHLQHDAAPDPEKEKFGADELEKMYGSKSKPNASDHLPKIHQELTGRGFKHFQDNGYSFYKKDDHIISVNHSSAQWIKSTKGKGRTIGSGHGDLVRYFNQYGNR